MIISIGIDVFYKKRKKNNKKFKIKIFNKNEIQANIFYIKVLVKFFTIKEAIIKTIGTGFRYGITFKKIKIFYNKFGKPTIKSLKNIRFLVTTSDEKLIIVVFSFLIKLNKFY